MHHLVVFPQVGKAEKYYNEAMGYTKHALAGFSYATAQKIAVGVLSLAKAAILARLIGPEAFGVFALVIVAVGVSEATTQTGVNITIVQSDKPIDYFVDTAWVIAIVRGAAISVLTLLLGYGLSLYYAKPDLMSLIYAAACIPLIKGFINPTIVTMQKNLQFDRDAAYRFSLSLVETMAAISLGLIFHSAWALVGGMVLAALFEVGLSLIVFSPKPKWRYQSSCAKVILHNGKSLSISTLLGYLLENLDDLIVGKTTSTYTLGLYHNAYALAHKPNMEVSKLSNHSLLPIYTRVTDDLKRLMRAFRSSLGWITLLIVILSLPLVIWPQPIIYYVLGATWLPAAAVLAYLTAAGVLQAIANTCYVYLIALGRYKLLNVHLLISVLSMAIFVYFFSSQYGLWGAGVGLMLSRLITLPLLLPTFWLKPNPEYVK